MRLFCTGHLFGPIQTSQTGGQPHIDAFPYGECSLLEPSHHQCFDGSETAVTCITKDMELHEAA